MKPAVALTRAGADRWSLSGALDFSTVPEAWRLLEPVVSEAGAVSLSLAGVQRANSAALGLLLEAEEVARRSGCRLVLRDVPAKLRDLAAVSNLDNAGLLAEA
ncbi:MAG: STAS domain-containing protein [Gammaproteobacteria bacterium]|jgi:phospholipid transport system transporter-binding protein